MKQYLLISLSLFAIIACNKPVVDTSIYGGTEFYPLAKGNYVIYDVTQINYNIVGTIDTIKFQIKEQIGDTNSSTPNSPFSYKVLRYRRDSVAASWTQDSTWEIWTNANSLVKNENGQEYVKLTFPIINNQQWNGNAYNGLPSSLYQFRDFGQNMVVNNNYFKNTVVVMETFDTSRVSRDVSFEYYADNIGLIYREWQNYIYDQATLGTYSIATGTHYIQQISSYGKE